LTFGVDDISMPVTEHSAAILTGSWPSQTIPAWSGYEKELNAYSKFLFTQLDIQYDIKRILGGMSGAFIDAALELAYERETALQNRIEGYRYLAKQILWAANELHATKADLVEIVNQAEEEIQAARDAAEKAKAAALPVAAVAIDAQLQVNIASIVADAKGTAQARDLQGAGTIAELSAKIGQWTMPFVHHTLPETGGEIPGVGDFPAAPTPAAPAPIQPQPQDGTSKAQPVKTFKDSPDSDRQSMPQRNSSAPTDQQRQFQQAGAHNPDSSNGLNQSGTSPQRPGASTSQDGLGSAGSVAGHMMRPISSGGSSPASSGSPLSSAGNGLGNLGNPTANPAATQGAPMANPNAAAAPGAPGAAASAAGQAQGLASLGGGIAETSARMASGAISGAANGLGVVANASNQVAQNIAAGTSQAPAQAAPGVSSPAALTPSAAAAGPATAGAPMAMVPPSGGVAGGSAVAPVGGTAATPTVAQPISSSPASVASSPPGAVATPLAMPQNRGVGSVGADGATGDVLFEQAMVAGHDVIAAMMAQISAYGYIAIDFAVSLIWERDDTVTAWLATSEGASCIPLGVRVPEDVKLAVADPVVGRELWETTAAAGGADPLEVVVRHAQAREMAAPGARVLAIASSMKMAHVIDWAREIQAKPVSVAAKDVGPVADLNGNMLHRCSVAMPWEWRQANAFDEQQRLLVAARHMHMATTTGHLSGYACEKVMRLFEERKPIDDELWEQVRQERFNALIEYEMANRSRGSGGAEPARALATARAAEVIECLRHYKTAEGCADLLYATRLAGAPLHSDAAVA
jgi:hypothetical protein